MLSDHYVYLLILLFGPSAKCHMAFYWRSLVLLLRLKLGGPDRSQGEKFSRAAIDPSVSHLTARLLGRQPLMP